MIRKPPSSQITPNDTRIAKVPNSNPQARPSARRGASSTGGRRLSISSVKIA